MKTYAELKSEAKSLGLKVVGTSEVLAASIEKAKLETGNPVEEPVTLAPAITTVAAPEAPAPSIAHKSIEWGHQGKTGTYQLGDLLSYIQDFNKRTGIRIQVNPEENTIHGFNRRTQAQTCTTLCQPIPKIKQALSKWAGIKFLAIGTDPDSALEIASRDGKYDMSEYSDIIMDTAAGLEQDGHNYTIG